jgi:hypothetical protein
MAMRRSKRPRVTRTTGENHVREESQDPSPEGEQEREGEDDPSCEEEKEPKAKKVGALDTAAGRQQGTDKLQGADRGDGQEGLVDQPRREDVLRRAVQRDHPRDRAQGEGVPVREEGEGTIRGEVGDNSLRPDARRRASLSLIALNPESASSRGPSIECDVGPASEIASMGSESRDLLYFRRL